MRTVLSLVFLAAILWGSCTVKLGRHTLAEHVDRIGGTDEAKALLDGARGKISPVLEDMKQRILGEYVEAPTTPVKERVKPASRPRRAVETAVRAPEPQAREGRGPSTAEAARLPGARR